MRNRKQLALLATIPLAIGGWALFRPELLFVNQSVDEKLPTVGNASVETLASGSFESYAHETKGMAQIVESAGKTFLRLSEFHTSNGPDVRVYLTKGSDTTQAGVHQDGFVDLGPIKGNIGNQNYELPAGTKADQFGGVAIWCKRFDVGFGGATLKSSAKASTNRGTLRFASYEDSVVVTRGQFVGTPGKAEFIEENGKRFLQILGAKAPVGTRILLVKAESAKTSSEIASSVRIDLGAIKPGPRQRFEVGKDVDAWLYRTVSLWSRATPKGKSLGYSHLRSDQETPKADPIQNLLA